ncbi:MAG: hypothetical protein MUO64_09885, partial [Anaerolineales bacterium]|nr:hypothetical protein [Anaerolineales bacterium]
GGTDPRLPVGFLDKYNSKLNRSRQDLLASPQVIHLHAEQLQFAISNFTKSEYARGELLE